MKRNCLSVNSVVEDGSQCFQVSSANSSTDSEESHPLDMSYEKRIVDDSREEVTASKTRTDRKIKQARRQSGHGFHVQTLLNYMLAIIRFTDLIVRGACRVWEA